MLEKIGFLLTFLECKEAGNIHSSEGIHLHARKARFVTGNSVIRFRVTEPYLLTRHISTGGQYKQCVCLCSKYKESQKRQYTATEVRLHLF